MGAACHDKIYERVVVFQCEEKKWNLQGATVDEFAVMRLLGYLMRLLRDLSACEFDLWGFHGSVIEMLKCCANVHQKLA